MKHLLNTLFVTTQGAYLSKEGDTVLVRVEKETKLQIPIHTLGGIICFGQVSCSPFLMEMCGRNNVGLAFLSEHGKFLARVQGPISGNVLLRREQYHRADNPGAAAEIAKVIVLAKVSNCRAVLSRAARECEDKEKSDALSKAVDYLAILLDEIKKADDLEYIRGKEGEAARTYFGAFDHLILAQKEFFYFHERSRRPPLDNVNALLSFLYTLLAHDTVSALESVGLDPQVGFLHCERPGRPSLALDIMEEFRPYLADRLALSLINRQQIKGKGFEKTESGAVIMNDATRKELLVSYQKRKQEEILHPFINEKISIGLLPYVQSLLLARHLRGDLDGYPPFFWR